MKLELSGFGRIELEEHLNLPPGGWNIHLMDRMGDANGGKKVINSISPIAGAINSISWASYQNDQTQARRSARNGKGGIGNGCAVIGCGVTQAHRGTCHAAAVACCDDDTLQDACVCTVQRE